MKFRITLLFIVLLNFSCEKEEENANKAPDTFFAIEEINLAGDDRLNSIVRLTWYGTDPDGYIKGYEVSTDGINWGFTTIQDSTFQFGIAAGSDTADIRISVRAIDNDNAIDPTPDELLIPIKNTIPSASFDDGLSIADTVNLVATTEWKASDLDGSETITEVLISLNGADWYPLNKTKNIFSIVPANPTATDTTEALIYYGTESNPQAQQLKGLVLNDTNKLLIKAVDQAGAESPVDTSNVFYMRGKNNDLLVVGGVPLANSIYADILQNGVQIQYDFIDLAFNNGVNQPKLWNISFRLLLLQYSKLFFYSDDSFYTNPYTNVINTILEFAAASLQEYANGGGKYFVSTSFPWSQNIDGFVGVLPISSKSATNYSGPQGASLYSDSAIVSNLDSFPDLSPQNFLLTDIGVYNIDTADTDTLYIANVVKGRRDPWPDTRVIASGRRGSNMKFNQIYFGIQLWRLNKNPAELNKLFKQILNEEFN